MLLPNAKSIFFIAEIGINHNGDFKVAKELIDNGIYAQVQAIKFQYRNLARAYSENPMEIGDQILKKEIERNFLSVDKLLELTNYAKLKGLKVGISFFDKEDIKDFGTSIKLFDFFKIPSVKMSEVNFINSFSKFRKPVLISTGAHDEFEINKSFKSLKFNNWYPLHCVSNYPTIIENARLGYIKTLKNNWKRAVGFSSHDEYVELLIPAYIFGARIFERHITLNKDEKGLDHSSSSTLEELLRIIQILKRLPSGLTGEGPRQINRGELINKQNLGKSYHASVTILKGTKLRIDMVSYKSPNIGISNQDLTHLIGKVLKRDCHINDALTKSHFEVEDELDIAIVNKMNRYKVSLPTRLHDYHLLNQKFPLTNFELHLSYSEISQLNNFELREDNKILSLHLPDYQDSVSLFNPFGTTGNRDSKKILTRVFEFSEKYFKKKHEKLKIIGSFAKYTGSKDTFYRQCRELQNEFDRNFAELCFQWLPPYAWYFGGSFKVQAFHNLNELELILDNNLRICMDLSHLFLGANYFGYEPRQVLKFLDSQICHFHIANSEGIDGEGLQFNQGEKENLPLIMEVLKKPHVKVIEIWQGHLNHFEGFKNSIKILDKYLK